MVLLGTLQRLVLVGTCLSVYGTPVHLPDCSGQCIGVLTTTGSTQSTDVQSVPSGSEHQSGLKWEVGAKERAGGAGPHGQPESTAPVTQTEHEYSFDGISGPSQTGDALVLPVFPDAPVTIISPAGGRMQSAVTNARLPPDGFATSFTARPQMSITAREGRDQGRGDRTKLPSYGESLVDKDHDSSFPSSAPNPGEWMQKMTSNSPIPPLVFVGSQTSTPLSAWGQDGATLSPLPDTLLPEIGPNLMPREDGPETLWTEATRPSGADTVVPPSQDEPTEGTMSSKALPLIFEPLEDVTSEEAAAESAVTPEPGGARCSAAPEVDLEQLDAVEADSDGPSHAPPPLVPDWTTPWQASGTEVLETISSLGPSVLPPQAGAEPEHLPDRDAARTPNPDDSFPTDSPTVSFVRPAPAMIAMAANQPAHKSRSGLEEMESEEEPDEDEDDENSEESLEDESEEDLTQTPKTSSTQPPYSIIPPPPIWVQRNQGLMRSWVELIREKAGYVSGMLAPVGIGIAGALLIVGALYSIRRIHRKRRNSFKHQRRKARQPDQPREPRSSRQDQAMLLADSSEDEF